MDHCHHDVVPVENSKATRSGIWWGKVAEIKRWRKPQLVAIKRGMTIPDSKMERENVES